MRDAGCTATEIMATRPREILRALPEDPHLWELAAGTMAAAGHGPNIVAGHLVAHAPTLDAFAAGIAAGIDDRDTIHAWRNPAPTPPAVSIGAAVSADDAATLLAVLPPPGPSVDSTPADCSTP